MTGRNLRNGKARWQALCRRGRGVRDGGEEEEEEEKKKRERGRRDDEQFELICLSKERWDWAGPWRCQPRVGKFSAEVRFRGLRNSGLDFRQGIQRGR